MTFRAAVHFLLGKVQASEGRLVARRRVWTILGVWVGVSALVTACSEPTRYQVLSFFFDGVPKPGTKPPKGYPAPGGTDTDLGPSSRPAAVAPTYSHPPYRENRCGVCHDAGSGLLVRTPQQGLCRSCHPDVPGDVAYVHGPVAVGDCLYCHRPHSSFHPKLLVKEGSAMCLDCHDGKQLTMCPHREAGEGTTCGECHDPHGGADRFFLRRSER
jgi:predicted CXXCH cytochrome family protein